MSGPSSLLYSSYLGGAYADFANDIAVDGSGLVYITGYTYSTNFPTRNQYQTDQGGIDVFVAKLNTAMIGASSLRYSTYLGGAGEDRANGIAVDGSGYVYVTGCTGSLDFPTVNQYQVDPGDGNTDVFVTKLFNQAPFITITSPNGGENWPLGCTKNITWNSSGVSGNVKITLWQGSALIGVIANNLAPAPGTYAWKVGQYLVSTAPAGIGYTIKIKEIGTLVSDVSDASFTISSSITVTSPNGGESWKIGNTRNITWDAPCISGNVKITLWKSGALVGVIANNLAPATGTYPWIVGQYIGGTAPAGSGYIIKIKEIATMVSDSSNSAFTLTN
jgi:hypothetical protein